MKWIAELPPHSDVPRRTLLEWLIRNFDSLSRWSSSIEDQGSGPGPGPDPVGQPIMILGGTADSFLLNSVDSKLENYSLSGEQYTSGSVDPGTGEITIPEDGIYTIMANVLGLQGNDRKEEWIELKLDIAGVERYIIGFADVTTDKTITRQVISFGTRSFTEGQVLSLYMWASAALDTFTVTASAFEVHKIIE